MGLLLRRKYRVISAARQRTLMKAYMKSLVRHQAFCAQKQLIQCNFRVRSLAKREHTINLLFKSASTERLLTRKRVPAKKILMTTSATFKLNIGCKKPTLTFLFTIQNQCFGICRTLAQTCWNLLEWISM